MSAAIAMNACSTLVAFFALVSMKGMPISSANAWLHEKNTDYQNAAKMSCCIYRCFNSVMLDLKLNVENQLSNPNKQKSKLVFENIIIEIVMRRLLCQSSDYRSKNQKEKFDYAGECFKPYLQIKDPVKKEIGRKMVGQSIKHNHISTIVNNK